jgi:large repetitive protein
VFIADCGTGTSQLMEIPFTGGSYGTPVTRGSGLDCSNGIGLTVDANDNVFVVEPANNTVKQFAANSGSSGTPVAVLTGFNFPLSVGVDQAGQLYVLDFDYIWRLTP